MKNYTLLVFSAFLLVSCSAGSGKMDTKMEDKMLSSGIEMSNFDTTVRPQDDIYQYVNGTWLANTEIPADKSNYGSFTELRDMSDERMRKIIDEASMGEDGKSEELQKVGAFYKSYMNTELIEELGITPLAGELSMIESVSNYDVGTT